MSFSQGLMAKPKASFFTNRFLCHNPKPIQHSNPSTTIRDRNLSILGVNESGQGPVVSDSDDKNSNKLRHLSEIAKDVSRIIRTRARWEKTLLSDFPGMNFSDPNLYREVLKQQHNLILALRFYYWLSSQKGFLPDPVTSNVIFRELVEAKAGRLAKSFIGSMKFVPDPSSLEAYIECLCNDGLIDEALLVLDELKGVGHCPTLSTWNSTLFSSIKSGKPEIVWKLYEHMTECGVTGDADTIGYLIYAFCMDNNHSRGYELLKQLLDTGHVPNNIVFNKLIYESCKNKEYFRMTGILYAMMGKNCSPDVYTYQEVIHGVRDGNHTRGRDVFQIFKDIKSRGHAPDMVMYSTVIHSLVKANMLQKAKEVWFEMIKKKFVPNNYIYNALIYGYLKIGDAREAERLYKDMLYRGCVDSSVTYNILISGFCENRMFMKAYRLFQHMLSKDIPHDDVTYHCLIKGFFGGQKAASDLKSFYKMRKHGLQPSIALYKVLIRRLCEEGCVEKA
ncbi:unnamed protein product [Cuscuta epithymum]|uniref:Pentatricopeptide repeat-containing protein n=1 Tax=Cuscuta epithymum TaxID=186058 RepID=A0AAV0C509_9ASTE|nr:unnamed protein product [Cuscuta epithymum]